MSSPVLRRAIDDGGVLRAEVVGEVDISSAFALRESLLASATNTTLGVVLDLTRTTYLDSAGIHVLLQLHRRLRARRQQLRLVAPDDAAIVEVLVITGVPSLAPLHQSVDEAVAAIREGTSGRASPGDQPASGA